MTDCELRELGSTSQEEGFKALFQQYQSYVYTIVWNQLRIVGTAEECMLRHSGAVRYLRGCGNAA